MARAQSPTYRRIMFMVGTVLVSAVVVLALVSLVWTPYGALTADPSSALQPPSWDHWMGTDRFGRDTLSRIMIGSQISLGVSMVAVAVGAGVGVPLGILAAVTGTWLDAVIMRASDLALAFPALLLAIIAGAVVGTGTTSEMIAMGIALIPSFAHVSRAGIRQLLSQDYILAARSAGMGWLSISRRHFIRGIVGLLVVQATVSAALSILAEAGLSFLGLGTPPPAASWGRMLHDSQVFLDTHPDLALWPGLAIATTVLGFNLLGDGLRDIIDPFSRPTMGDVTSDDGGAITAALPLSVPTAAGEPIDHPTSASCEALPAGALPSSTSSSAILHVRDLSLAGGDVSTDATHGPRLVDSLSFTIEPGARLGLIGESGSGKSLTALAIMGLLPDAIQASGSITVDGIEIVGAPDRTVRQLRSVRMSMVFQEPMSALNPLMTVGNQLNHVLRAGPRGAHHADQVRRQCRIRDLLESVGLPERTYRSYPFELSGGQRQRVLIAMAFAHEPDLLICDEPTTALDVTVQRSILELINQLVRANNTALLFITHDLGLVAHMCDDILVMKDGVAREYGPVDHILHRPRDSYTAALVRAACRGDVTNDASRDTRHVTVPIAEAPSNAGALGPSGSSDMAFIQLREVSKVYRNRITRRGGDDRVGGHRWLCGGSVSAVTALDNISLDIARGERIGIVGESGSGKTTLLKTMAGLVSPTSGTIHVNGHLITSPRDMSPYGQVVFQDPRGSLDPALTIGESLAEPLRASWHPRSRDHHDERISSMLQRVGLDPSVITRYPHQVSGGQRQRICLARALTVRPQILLADEPVSALDVTIRNMVVDLLDDLVSDYDLTMVLLSHDINVVRHLCTTIIVMKDGQIVEKGTSDQIYHNPCHEYTRALIAAAVESPSSA